MIAAREARLVLLLLLFPTLVQPRSGSMGIISGIFATPCKMFTGESRVEWFKSQLCSWYIIGFWPI